MSESTVNSEPAGAPALERQRMDVDIVCVGFGPAMGGFLTTLSRRLMNADGTPKVESASMPGMPLQVLCYERAEGLGFGVSGVVTPGKGIRESFPDLDIKEIPMAAPVREEKVLYLLDPIGASRRATTLRVADRLIRACKWALPVKEQAFELPWTPAFLHKHGGFVCSLGQFNQWVANQLMSSGTVQLWPGTPVAKALVEGPRVLGVQLMDQGTGRAGEPTDGFMPGMEVRAALTVIGDGPVGPIGQQMDRELGLPDGHAQHDWAVGAKMVIDLPEGVDLEPGTVLHTFGYPEPEIFGFFYVHPGRIVSVGIFVPSWFDSPVRSTYRYLQHWMMHPYIWRYLKGGRLRSWGAKTLQESGRRGEPHLAGDGFARIGEGSGSTNVLTGSGVDEAWTTGALLAEGVLQLLQEKQPFTRENLDRVYVRKRRAHRIEAEGRIAEKSRDGFQRGVVTGMLGMALAGFTKGKLAMPGKPLPPYRRVPTIEEYYRDKISEVEIAKIRKDCVARGVSLHQTLMDRAGWPAIPFDGQLLMTHQDALLLGGKVQAPPGYADHVAFLYPRICEKCENQLCVEVCSGQAITPGPKGVPAFDREKCVHCGACLWNCTQPLSPRSEQTNLQFRAGAGGLHSAEN
jgi:electron-transferring-flavoprotein dehydrogenase